MRIVKYITLVFVGFLWFLGCSPRTANWMADKGLVKDDYRYGDLYRMANLPKFKSEKPQCENIKPQKTDGLHLVLAGDSFTEDGRMAADDFVAEKFSKIRVDQQTFVELSGDDQNVLIIETVERHFRERFSEQWRGVSFEKTVEKESGLFDWIVDLKMPYSTELHSTVLFGYDFTMRIREWKALLNQKVFERVDEGVKLNASEEHLLYHLPSKKGISSAFDTINEKEIDTLVRNVNQTSEYYLSKGFDRVVVSIIPNKTSILGKDLGTYNELVSKIQNHPDFKVFVIDVYTDFEKMGEKAYALGDTHWSCEGQYLWLEKANEAIVSDLIELQ